LSECVLDYYYYSGVPAKRTPPSPEVGRQRAQIKGPRTPDRPGPLPLHHHHSHGASSCGLCICIYIYAYIYAYTHAHTHTHTKARTHSYIHIHIYTYIPPLGREDSAPAEFGTSPAASRAYPPCTASLTAHARGAKESGVCKSVKRDPEIDLYKEQKKPSNIGILYQLL